MREKPFSQLWLFVFICFLGIPQYLTARSIDFISVDFKTVSKKSLKENKYFFVNYSADWCAACEIMVESANANQELVKYVSQNFIAVKANVENTIGKKWQSQFDVRYLPTIIIFSPDGNEIARSSGGISSSNFLSFLQKIETQNQTILTSKPAKTKVGKKENTISKVATKKSIVSKKEAAVFRVQVGLYSSLENANKKIEKMKMKFSQPVYFRQEKVKKILYYQVVVGDPLIEKDAVQLQKKLASKGVKSYILKY